MIANLKPSQSPVAASADREPPLDKPPEDIWRDARRELAELKKEVARYASAKLDLGALSLRRVAVRVTLGLLAVYLLVVTATLAVFYAVQGLAAGLSALAGGHTWFGSLAAGAGILLSLAVAILMALSILKKNQRRKTVERYEPQRKPASGDAAAH